MLQEGLAYTVFAMHVRGRIPCKSLEENSFKALLLKYLKKGYQYGQ